MKRDPGTSPVTEKSLFHWAFRDNLKLQLILLSLILLIVGARVVPLEMQKRIINDAIALKNLDALFLYCLIYIIALTTASALKLAINYLQALIGERAMTVMRKELYEHILGLPLHFFRTTQPGMVVSSLMTELSAAGTFAGMAFAVPLTNILTLLAFTVYLLWLNPKLAATTLVIYPLVMLIIPQLQKRANQANKKRVDISRSTSSQIAESISGIHEIQVHGAYRQESDKFGQLAERLKKVRIRWSLFRFGIKTANNYFTGLGPFIVFLYGGYLVMHGQLALGAMVAFLSAQEKLFDPWKELIDFYQVYQDATVRYRRTMRSFTTTPDFTLELPAGDAPRLSGELAVHALTYDTADGLRLLNGVSFSLQAGEHLAVVGFSGGGKSTLIQCIGKMFPYSGGSIQFDGRELSELGKMEIIRDIGYVSQSPFIFTGTVRENLLYARQALPAAPQAGGTEDLDRQILVLQQVGLFVDVMRFGLETPLEPEDAETTRRILAIRARLRQEFGKKLADCIEFYDWQSYHRTSTIAENIVFGSGGSGSGRDSGRPGPDNQLFRQFLGTTGLLLPLVELGLSLARQAVDVLAGLGGIELFFKNSPVPADQLERCEALTSRLPHGGGSDLPRQDQDFLLALALQFTPANHTMTRLDDELAADILTARLLFAKQAAGLLPGGFTPYGETALIPGQSILNNIFFGRIRPGMPSAQERINRAVMHTLVEEDYLEKIAAIGMESPVGTMGDRLSGGQRQKLAIARVLLKQPSIILMDEATSALDNKSQTRIQRLMTNRWRGKRTVIAVVHRLDSIDTFDKIAVMKAGKLVEYGSYQDLIGQRGMLHELIYGKNLPDA